MNTKRLSLLGTFLLTLSSAILAQTPPDDNVVITKPPISTAQGKTAIKPATGTPGHGSQFNFLPYIVPGQFSNPTTNKVDNDPFDIAYANRTQPVQTSDWWTGVGLQWIGWAEARKADQGQIGRSNAFMNEPFHFRFMDIGPGVNNDNQVAGIPLLVHGLRFWNQNAISVRTDGRLKPTDTFDTVNNFIGRGNVATERSPIVTVGLANVHPLGLDVREKAPFSNIKVQSYSDWGAVFSYADAGSELTITMANGSPFVWMERTQGLAAFVVWAGDRNPAGDRKVWFNQNGVLGITVTNAYNPYNNVPQATSTAAYVVIADTGTWTESVGTSEKVSMFSNAGAGRVVVLAMPHNVNFSDTNALIAVMNDLRPYACRKIVNTKVHYPPIPGSDANVTVGGQTLPLGFDEKNSIIRSKLEVTTAPFSLPGCTQAGALQLIFPHQRKTLVEANKANVASQYVWNSLKGQLYAYKGDSYVRELRSKGILPYMPSVALNSTTLQNPLSPPQLAVDDVYATMTNWFFKEELQPNSATGAPQHLDSFVRNMGTYVGVQFNTYIQGIAALYESMIIADQLAQSTALTGVDPTYGGRAKTAIAAEMRNVLLDALKELLGQWANVYTSQFFQYNSEYNSMLGFPEGYGSAQNFNDHHFHYGYFLKTAAAIGRYDPAWLEQYMPLIDELRRDVANYDRADTKYPFMREFSPFYGHSFANGTADAGGNDQESTSESLNFAAGLIELGQVRNNKQWRDLGIYMYEEEILATEQYWFNQDADLTKSSGTLYNGNWPDSFVRYVGPDGSNWNTTLVGINAQFALFRTTFGGGGIHGTYIIQELPLSASSLYLQRNQTWLKATWDQYVRDAKGQALSVYEVLVSGLQARLPGTGTTADDPGLTGALRRIERVHNFFLGSTNAMGKYWAYTNAQLGQLDATVVADTTSYAVFKKGNDRVYIAYNSTAEPITVTFTDLTTNAKTPLQVPAFGLKTKVGNGPEVVDTLTPPKGNSNRLYLRSGSQLARIPGTWQLPEGQTSFPKDEAALAPSLVSISPRSDLTPGNLPFDKTPPYPPPGKDIVSWTGRFSGRYIGGAAGITRFALYANNTPFPGWQQDPAKAGNTLTIRFIYDFNADGTPDRIEVLQNSPLFTGNAFLYSNKVTEYIGDHYIKGVLGATSFFLGGPDQEKIIRYMAPFPASVSDGILTIQIYGGSDVNLNNLHPFVMSQDAALISNRASWVEPPFEALPGPGPGPEPDEECFTLCFSGSEYYLRNLSRLPKGAVIIKGINFGAPVSTSNLTQMKLALDGGNTPLDSFNKEFVAAQLSLLAANAGQLALATRLDCYDLQFAPVILDSGVTITPDASLDSLFDQARIAVRSASSSDLAKITELLAHLNGDGKLGRCSR